MAFQNPLDSPLYSQKITGTLGYNSPVAKKSVAPVSNSPSSRTKSFYDETTYMDWFQIGLNGVTQMTNAITMYGNYMSEASKSELSASMNKVNQERLSMNVDFIQNEYQQKMNTLRRQTAQSKGQMRESMSKSGFEVGSGSFVDMESETDRLANDMLAGLDAQREMQQIQNKHQQAMLGIQAKLDETKASVARKQARISRTYGTIAGALNTTAGALGAYGRYQHFNG